jgi:myo-inositol 2-dehydrogenase / D-chiro-inositol 1-dehydrogenase
MKPKLQSRREFFEGAVALGVIGAMGASNILSSCKSPNKEQFKSPVLLDKAPDGKPLKAALIGCGGRGTGAAMNFLNAGSDLQLTVLGDVFQESIDRCRGTLKKEKNVDIPDQNCFVGFDAYKRVMDTDVDVVLLTTPPHFRPIHFEAAVKARKHAFIEKPCAVDPVGARSVMASGKIAEEAGLSVVSGLQLRHSRDFNATYEMIKNGAIGKLISGNSIRLGGGFRLRVRQEGWSDMEWMLRDWQNWTWLSGDHIAEQMVHHIDVLNWFFGKPPVEAIGFGARHRRPTGDQYDFFSVDYAYDEVRRYHVMHRQIPGCYNRSGSHLIYGTTGYTNCQNKIWDYEDNLIWEYPYPLDEEGEPSRRMEIPMTDQSHINLVTAIRTNTPVNESFHNATSSLTAVMGRESAYTGKLVTWDDMMQSDLRLGPTEYEMGPVDLEPVPPVPGIPAT